MDFGYDLLQRSGFFGDFENSPFQVIFEGMEAGVRGLLSVRAQLS
jgi:hypothetical protein